MFKKFALALSLSVCLATSGEATTYYVVSGTGNDTNDGKSLGTPFLTINHANSVVVPGDNVYCIGTFGGGTGGSEPVTINVPGTAAGGYITYASYYQGMTGVPCLINSTQAFNTVHITPSSTKNIAYIKIIGLEVAGSNGSITLASAWTNASATTYGSTALYNGAGIIVDAGSNPTVQTATGTNNSGQTVINTSTNPVSGGVLPGDYVYDTVHPASTPTGGAIVLSTTTSSMTLTSNLVGAVSNGDTLTVVHVPHHIVISNNYVHDFPENCIQAAYGDYLTVSYNTVANCSLYSPYAGSAISMGFARDIDTTTGYKIQAIGNLTYNSVNLIANHFSGTTINTNGTTAAGNAVLHVASTSGIANGMQIFNTHAGNSGSILAGTTVQSFVTNTSITMTNNAQTGSGSGVGNGDAILFNQRTDGEGIIFDDNNGDQQGMPHYGGASLAMNNVVVGNGSGGISAFDSWNVDILYNTLYYNMQGTDFPRGEVDNYLAVNGHVENNILVTQSSTNPGFQDSQTSGMTLAYNLGYGGNGTFSGSNNITGSNPLFVNASTTLPIYSFTPSSTNFQLSPGSPAIDVANAAFPRTYTDFLGNPAETGLAYDMGAFESVCPTYSTSTIRTIQFIMQNELQDGQLAGSITAGFLRDAIATLSCGRSPWAH